jgi:hypothetical protein
LTIAGFDAGCVTDDGADGHYPKGAGTVMVMAGTAGRVLTDIALEDPEIGYFAAWMGANVQPRHGVVKVTVTPSRLSAVFVGATPTSQFSDVFVIGEPDTEPPSPPTDMAAPEVFGNRVRLTWSPAADDIGVAAYEVFRGGAFLDRVTTTELTDHSVAPETTYRYEVVAVDAGGNRSLPSDPVVVTTPAGVFVLTFTATDDATLRADNPTKSYGGATTLEARGKGGRPGRSVLLKFVVSGIGTRTVESARLELFSTNGSDHGGEVRRAAADGWSEATVTWSTAPAAHPDPVAALGPVATDAWHEVDVTALVVGDGPVSFRLDPVSTDKVLYTSSEGTPGFAPRLIVTTR